AWSKTPLSSGAGQDLKRAIEQTLRGLKRKAVVGIDEARVPRLYYCEDGRRTLLTYYKNTALHCFVQPNLALLGLLRALSSGRASRADVIASAVQLRDILKFEFFFDPKATFVKEVESILCYFLGDDWLGERFDLK